MSKFKAAVPKWCKGSSKNLNSHQRIRHFNEIPGPKALPVIGNTFRFIPTIAIIFIILDYRLGGLQSNLSKSHDAQRIIDANAKWFELMYKLEKLPLWKYLGNTPTLRHSFQVTDTVTEISKKYVDYATNRLKNQSKAKMSNFESMLERVLQQMTVEQAENVITRGMIPGAIGTIANTVGAALYAIADNPQVQAKLFAELRIVLPDLDSPFTMKTYRNVPYLKACLKETLRMFPTVLGNTRTMARDIVLGGFIIPKGVSVFSAHAIMGQRSEQFPESQTFIPERWLGYYNVRLTNEAHAYAVLPFGKGPRTCVARYLAAREMTIDENTGICTQNKV